MSFTAALIAITCLLLTLYLILINIYLYWFSILKPEAAETLTPLTRFSVIIPARNEEDNIGACLRSVFQNDYPPELYEVIVADDFSTDATASIVQHWQQTHNNIVLIQLKDVVHNVINSYKKRAVEIAIECSPSNWIVRTDADCIVPRRWLSLMNNAVLQQKIFIAAPVMFTYKNSVLSIFQCLDFISLQGITAASVSAGFLSMCNGANLAYSKNAFNAINGFKGIDNIASGDDMLLMHKMKLHYPQQIGYIFNANAIVHTEPMPDWRSFIHQRIRWASKATSYGDKKIISVLLLVYLTNFFLLVLLITSFFSKTVFLYAILLLLIKALFELPFMYKAAGFFKLRQLLVWFVLMQPLHVVYTVASGLLGKFGTYEWKGRHVK